jgi:4-diphosphocytidyl-2-C-methyl-D-erythritol kinase
VSIARLVAQAKVNLLLRVLAREASGYHSIESIFLRLELGDDVTVRVTHRGRAIDCTGPAMPGEGLGPPERNLAWRAATTYADATGWPASFAIEIEKHIPVGGGLGGGSADAGAVLRALDALSPRPLGTQLVELAAALGADVPFLTLDSPMALAWSRGERMMPLHAPSSRPVALVLPGFGVRTSDAYGWLAEDRGTFQPGVGVLRPTDVATWDGLATIAANDLEPVVSARHPEISRNVDALHSAGASIARMSGSGSASFGVFASEPDVAELARATGTRVVATRTAERVVRVRPVE